MSGECSPAYTMAAMLVGLLVFSEFYLSVSCVTLFVLPLTMFVSVIYTYIRNVVFVVLY